MTPHKRKSRARTSVRVFLGGAAENDRFVNALARQLKKHAFVDSWRTVFRPGEPTLESLRRAATAVDFAVFVWGRDDRTISRKRATASPRDNVVYEAGLFAGYLGSNRTFVIHAPDTKVPTDYLGVTMIPQTDVEEVSSRIEHALGLIGPVPRSKIVGCWWQLVTSGYESSSVISFFEIMIEPDTRLVSMQGTSWNRDGRLVATWHCPAAAFDTESMRLHYSWTGVRTREEALPTYFGVGDISFQREPFVGTFSSAPRAVGRDTVFRRARYVRAGPNDARVVYGTDVQARRRLVRRQLELRATFAET